LIEFEVARLELFFEQSGPWGACDRFFSCYVTATLDALDAGTTVSTPAGSNVDVELATTLPDGTTAVIDISFDNIGDRAVCAGPDW
jgi:hypothetical protein